MQIDDHDISRAIKIFLLNPEADDKPMLSILEDHGIPNKSANYLVLYIPLAFSRIVCKDLAVNFTNEYVEHYQDGKTETGSLSNNEMFLQVQKCSEQIISEGIGSDSILNIAGRSHEFKLVNDALNKGIELSKVKFSSIHFVLGI